MQGIGLAGLIAIAFGAGAYYATGQFGAFNALNLTLGAVMLAAAALRGARRLREARGDAGSAVLARSVLGVAAVVVAAVALERAAQTTGLQWDWSFQRRFELSPAVVSVLEDLPGLRATLYYEEFDPRTRSTRLLLRTLAQTADLEWAQKRIRDHPDDEDRFAIGSSNTVVFELDGRHQTVERPTEGTFYEALYRLRARPSGLLYVARGAGEGDLEQPGEGGFTGLAAALETEGFRVHQFVTAALDEVPEEAEAVLLIAPRRPLRQEALDAIHRYLERGGRLVAWLEPGQQSGVEALLARWGITSPDAQLVDPASGPVEGDPAGVNPLAYNYARHPVTQGLDAGRMTFFRGARSFELRKPQPGDELKAVAFASPRSWLASELVIEDGAPVRPADARNDYHPIVVAGRFPRPAGEARIVAIGDADSASNRYLRTLYNLDLVLNAIHWTVEQEPAITLRPKSGVSGSLQLPLPLQNTLTMFQSVGLLLPELLLIAGAFAWIRTRAA